MKKNILLVLVIAVATLCSSCSKTVAVTQLRDLASEVELNGATYSLNDWKEAAQKYGKIEKKISKHRNDYSSAELKEIGELRGKMISSMATGISTQAKGHVGEISSTLSTIFDQIRKKGNDVGDWKDLWKPFVDQLKSENE